ncbi:hypothetical protein N878_26825 [Pseudomonas sp. EGD-AK9]|nr:hypothetical protein N878_26825 [Pseudomonas sp. EGD-AK9]
MLIKHSFSDKVKVFCAHAGLCLPLHFFTRKRDDSSDFFQAF